MPSCMYMDKVELAAKSKMAMFYAQVCEILKTMHLEWFCDYPMVRLLRLYTIMWHVRVCRKFAYTFTTVADTPSYVNTMLHHTQQAYD